MSDRCIGAARPRPRVLLVDDDPGTLTSWGGTLTVAGFEVVGVADGEEALELARRQPFDVIVSDLQLPSASAIELLRSLRSERITAPFVIATGFGTVRSMREALASGAVDFVEKPLIGDELVNLVERVIDQRPDARPTSDVGTPRAHGAERWAMAVTAAMTTREDFRTLRAWACAIAVSPGVLRNWCYSVGLSPRRSLAFARLLRGISQANRLGWRVEDVLDIADERTLVKLFEQGGLESDGSTQSFTVDEFLQRQTLIHNPLAIVQIRAAVQHRSLLRT